MSDILLPDRRLLLLGGASLFLLAGCGGLLPTPGTMQIYVLNPAKPATQPGAKVSWALAIEAPDAGDSLDTSRIAISRAADTLDYYADAQWPDRLPELVADALVQGFQASGRIDDVGRSRDGLHADYVLQTRIRDFEARYDTPDGAPVALVRIAARLVGRTSRAVAGSLAAEQSAPASANTIPAAVEAFDTALGAAIAQIVDWALAAGQPIPSP